MFIKVTYQKKPYYIRPENIEAMRPDDKGTWVEYLSKPYPFLVEESVEVIAAMMEPVVKPKCNHLWSNSGHGYQTCIDCGEERLCGS